MHVRDTVIRRSRCRSFFLLACRYVPWSRLKVAGRWLAGYFEPSSFLQERLSRGAWGVGEDEGGLLVMNGMYTCILGFVWLVVVGVRD